MWKYGMHEREAKHGQDGVDDGNNDEVPVVGIALHQPVLRAVHHGSTKKENDDLRDLVHIHT